MYMSDPSLRGVDEEFEYDEEMIEELQECMNDPIYFIENYVMILSEAKLVHFVLRDYQKKYIKLLHECPRLTASLGRQVGKSISTAAYIVWFIIFNENMKVLLLADKQDNAIEQLQRIKEIIQELPLWMQQGVKTWNAKKIVLSNKSEIKASATQVKSGRGFTVNFMYLDEFAHVEPHIAKAFMNSVFPTVSSDPNAKIVITTTPLGLNFFWEMWEKARKKEESGNLEISDFRTLTMRWNEVPGRDEAFKRAKIDEIGEVAFNQEYDCAFEGSVATLVDSVFIKELSKLYEKDPIEVMDEKRLKIFQAPLPIDIIAKNNYEYVISIDPAMGTKQDYNAAHVWLIKSNVDIEQVALWHGNNVPPLEWVSKLLFLCKLYHAPYVICETNEPSGGIIASSLVNEHGYYNIINMQKEGIGFRMDHVNKIKSCTLLQVYCEKLLLKIHDSQTYKELSMFGKRANSFKALGDSHDDLVCAILSMLFYVNSKYFYGNIDDVSIYKRKSTMVGSGTPSSMDDLIKKALDDLMADDINNVSYASAPLIINGSREKYSDAVRWNEDPVPNQKNNPMFNPHADGNMYRYFKNGY